MLAICSVFYEMCFFGRVKYLSISVYFVAKTVYYSNNAILSRSTWFPEGSHYVSSCKYVYDLSITLQTLLEYMII